MGRDDALSMLRLWRDDGVLIRCDLKFRALAAIFWSRVVAVSDTEVRFLDEDRGELVLPLRADFTFSYGDMRAFPRFANKYRRGFVVLFPFEGDSGDADTILFAELAE
jgi:hypothetical protein